ncbi:hypothetical protein HGRIS_013285 [Hohenbuehelia grisea]|uniref:MYND-type domain-containing protein n=1 Tax=Hohenbuehelia grisea TaxID=104357 RepID=A0ABR3IV72_9AGAR
MSISLNGRQYPVAGLASEVVGLARQLAENARLITPLPEDTDLTDAEDKNTQAQVFNFPSSTHILITHPLPQIRGVTPLPSLLVNAWWLAFSAQHLPALATSLCAPNSEKRPKSVSKLIQILSLLPEPKSNPYLRRFLTNSTTAAGLPNAVARAFCSRVELRRGSGPGAIAALIANLLFWCPPSLGDDGKAAIDASLRQDLASKLEIITETASFASLSTVQQAEVQRLHGLLGALEAMPEATYVTSTRQYLEGQLEGCAYPDCDEDGAQRCTRCKSVEYCGKECQTLHWKNGHKLVCFSPSF